MWKIFMATIFVFLGFQLIPSIGHTEASKTIFVLFDLSGSTAKDEIRKEYLKNFKMIVDLQGIKQDFNKSMLRPGDVIVADIISGNSITDSTFPILKEFKNFSYWTDNKFRYGKYFRDNKEKLISKAEALLFNQRRKIMTTDIMSALRVAERIFRIFKKDGAVLVIMSDMIEESRDYNFARERLTGTRIQQILRLPNQNRRRQMRRSFWGYSLAIALSLGPSLSATECRRRNRVGLP